MFPLWAFLFLVQTRYSLSVTFLMSRRVICGGEVDWARPATLDPARGLIHGPAAAGCEGLDAEAAAPTRTASMRRRAAAVGGDWNTSSSTAISAAVDGGSTSGVAMLPQLLCWRSGRSRTRRLVPETTDTTTCFPLSIQLDKKAVLSQR